MLDYVLRIRDLVHGTILFTAEEAKVINHPLFQRLKQVRQHDVAFYVYPSMNTSRFEHALGVCRIAGMIAENLAKSPKWNIFSKALKEECGIDKKEEFVQLVRLYGLLHDVGHFPLSHLFEYALKNWVKKLYLETIEEWSGFKGFKKLHEAFGALIATRIMEDENLRFPGLVKEALLKLITEKSIPFSNPLRVAKAVIDSEIDADRIDFVQRDGLLAGGEYGHYDTRRLCDAAFVENDETGWLVAYSEKALTSMEALLLDRYRIYQWIHFHHKKVITQMLVGFLIGGRLWRLA